MLIAAAAYGLFFLLQRKPASASLSATVFMVFYYTYGLLYQWLVSADKFPVYHFSLLPLMIVIAIYTGLFISHLKPGVANSIKKYFACDGGGIGGLQPGGNYPG